MIRELALAIGQRMARVQKTTRRLFLLCGAVGVLVVFISASGYWLTGVLILAFFGLLQVCFSVAVGTEIDAALAKRAGGTSSEGSRRNDSLS